MFTGIIRELGTIASVETNNSSKTFIVKTGSEFNSKINTGDSISVNGACMTVEEKQDNSFKFTTVAESLSKTNLGRLKKDSKVNLESSLNMSSVLDGHMVSGHIDCTGKINEIAADGDSHEFFIEFPAQFSSLIIYKGSICINGISLTIAEITNELENSTEIKVAVIPHTFENTNLKFVKEKDIVNIEFDIIGKYINRKIHLNNIKI